MKKRNATDGERKEGNQCPQTFFFFAWAYRRRLLLRFTNLIDVTGTDEDLRPP